MAGIRDGGIDFDYDEWSVEGSLLETTLQALAASRATSGLCVVDAQQDNMPLIYVNQAFCNMTGYSQKELLGRNCRMLQGQGTDQASIDTLRQAIKNGEPCSVIIKNYRKDGLPFWNELSITPSKGLGGEVLHYIGVQYDVTHPKETEDALRRAQRELSRTNQALEDKVAERTVQLQDANARLKYDALHDGLTGLANRALFEDHLRRVLDKNARKGPAYTVIYLDLDRFKSVNDTLGHASGDELLRQVASRLRDCLRPEDIVARRGGDEFTVLAETPEGAHQARQLCRRIQARLGRPFWLGEGRGKEVSISASMGVVVGGAQTSTVNYQHPEEVLRDADIALYRAKALGRARHVFFQTPMRERNQTMMALESDLRLALRRNELRVVYQPIVSVARGRAVSLEALVRWQHPTRGLLRPAEFLALAEEAGLIVALDRWVLRRACEQLAAWRQARPSSELGLNVNLSSRQLSEEDTAAYVGEVIKESGVAPRHLHLELTEDALVSSSPDVRRTIRELANLGVDLHIDDFGTGYSSLAYLQSVPSHTLKLDRSFVQGLDTGSSGEALMRGVVNLAHELDKRVVAEGVETLRQLEHLKGLGCSFVQGNYLSKPLSAAHVSRFLGATQAAR